jgi:hypothetical protein
VSYEVPDLREIRKEAERLLARAEVRGELPTPVDDLVSAAGLVQPKRSMLANLVLNEAPAHLRGPIRRLRFKVQALLDREEREIHLDPSIDHPGQIAFKTLHEVAHDILPWQKELGYADDNTTLSLATRRLFEWQANTGAAELLFQRDLFRDMAHEIEIGLGAAFSTAREIGSSRRAGLHRYAETHRAAVAGVVLDSSPAEGGRIAYRRREVVLSKKFEERFGSIRSWPQILRSPPYTFLNDCPDACITDGVVRTQVVLPDLNNACQELEVELSSNSYNLLVLLWIPRRERGRRRVVIGPG